VLVEWWRGRSDLREKILAAVLVEPLHTALARSAGEALAAVAGATAIDAIVVASAALRGDTILTSDPEDLVRLADYFGGVRVLAV
jgi:predicted nucleic acid-binding protein